MEFDEAHYSQENRPRGARALIQLGYSSKPNTKFAPEEIKPFIQAVMNIQTVNPTHHLVVATDNEDTIIPRQATQDTAGYDLYSCVNITISPDSIGKVNTGVKVQLPKGTYGRIASRSGLVLRHKINIQDGVIDPDYTECIQVILHNFGKEPLEIHKGDRIAQLILEKFVSVSIQTVTDIGTTQRGSNGFGSTGINDKDTQFSQSRSMCNSTSIPHHKLQACDVTLCFHEPCDLLSIEISTKHTHPTLGLELEENLVVKNCKTGTPAAKIKQWRTAVKGTALYSVGGIRAHTTKDAIMQFHKCKDHTVSLQFNSIQFNSNQTNKQTPIHPESGTTQITFDQFVQIAQHHQDLTLGMQTKHILLESDALDPVYISKVASLPETLTRKKLIQQADWSVWEAAEKEQLDLYETQQMFSKPSKLPNNHGINV